MVTREHLTVYEDKESASQYLADKLIGIIGSAIAHNGSASLVVAGGSSFRRAYELLAAANLEWSALSVYFGDERCVGPEDPRSNFGAFSQALLSRLPKGVAPAIYRMEGELEPEAAAARYAQVLNGRSFDVALLGLGPDGHTASLFPACMAEIAANPDKDVLTCLNPGREPYVARVSMTPNCLRRAATVLVLATGEDKADIIAKVAEDGDCQYPISCIENISETIVDQAAAQSLSA